MPVKLKPVKRAVAPGELVIGSDLGESFGTVRELTNGTALVEIRDLTPAGWVSRTLYANVNGLLVVEMPREG
jgi:hypothetical protein